jgi:hypothetical protein
MSCSPLIADEPESVTKCDPGFHIIDRESSSPSPTASREKEPMMKRLFMKSVLLAVVLGNSWPYENSLIPGKSTTSSHIGANNGAMTQARKVKNIHDIYDVKTDKPSSAPSSAPTAAPSGDTPKPVLDTSARPTSAPTSEPTAAPSEGTSKPIQNLPTHDIYPVRSDKPSSAPSSAPTAAPSGDTPKPVLDTSARPTSAPTSDKKTCPPTGVPTSAPTAAPSGDTPKPVLDTSARLFRSSSSPSSERTARPSEVRNKKCPSPDRYRRRRRLSVDYDGPVIYPHPINIALFQAEVIRGHLRSSYR